jgi:UDP-GlcNAc:undecaprenyl-phosphate/decaprenyl-phosphate GlcNAc-1-phosphate transferase
MNSIPPYILYLITPVVSFIISLYSVRKIIFITTHRKIFDVPDNTRKIHGPRIPSLGGIGIFIGYIVVVAFSMFIYTKGWNYIMASTVILFFTGIYDDIMNMRPSKKLIAQLLASVITIWFADIRLTSLYGVFGINEIPYWLSIALTTVACTFFINAFNFIDGIDGLACALAILYTGMFGGLFAAMGAIGIAGISFGLAGATFGLLYFNASPAKIYMGDTGSMFLGFTIFMLSVLFISTYAANSEKIDSLIHFAPGALMIALSVLFLPMYDAIRVFVIRMSRKTSPLKADRTHLHYYLLDAGFTHSQSVLIIVTTNILIIGLALLLQDFNPLIVLFAITILASAVLLVVYRLRQKNLAKKSAYLNTSSLL